MKATYKLNTKLNGIEISFEAKPSEEVRTQLKTFGFRWSPKNSIWYTKQSEESLSFAKVLCNGEIGEMDSPKETETETRKPQEPVNQYGVKVGDLFVDCFGYDATIHNFYEVTAIKGKVMVELREVKTTGKQTGFCSWNSKPIKGKFRDDKTITKKTKLGYDGKTIYAGDFYQGDWDKWYENDDYH